MTAYDTALAEIRAELAELVKITGENAETTAAMADTMDEILQTLRECRKAAHNGNQ